MFFPRNFSSSITCQKHAKCPHLKKNELLCSNVSGCCSFNNTTNSGFEILFSSFYRSQFLQKVCGIIRYEKTRFSWKSDVLKCWRICCLVFSLRFCEFWKQACLNLLFETSCFEIILHIITTSSSKKTKKDFLFVCIAD